MEELPGVVGPEQLRGLAKNGPPCDICKTHMYDHKWVLMNSEGHVLFCSNTTFDRIERRSYHSKEWYKDEEKWESSQVFSIASGARHDSEEDYAEAIVENHRRAMSHGELARVHVYSYGEAVFHVDKRTHATLGEWTKHQLREEGVTQEGGN